MQESEVVLLDRSDAARVLRVAVSTMDKWRMNGSGPRFVYIGKRVFYPRVEIDRFVTNRLRGSTSERPSRA